MTSTGDGRSSHKEPGRRPSTEIVHVPIDRKALTALLKASNVSVERLLQDMRCQPALRHKAAPPAPAAHPTSEIAKKVRTVTLVPATPQSADRGVDAVYVQRVEGQLHTWVIQAKRSAHEQGRERAALGIFAALNARRAILESRTVDGWKPTVDEFARTWLGISHPDENWLEATSTALLGDWVDLLDEHLLDDAGCLGLKQLKKETATVHLQLQPLFKRKTNGARLLSLDHPVPGGGTLTDLLADHAAPSQSMPLWEPETDHAAAVFARLPHHEQELARIWATAAPGTTWPDFAHLTGLTHTDADHLRRKLRRLGRRHQQRQANRLAARARLTNNPPTTA